MKKGNRMLQSKLNVLYDGSCHLCYREVLHYKKKDTDNLLNIIDISSADFDAAQYGLDNEAVNLHMHAFVEKGRPFVGIDCFIEIWRRIPQYQWLIPIFENKCLRPLLNSSYDVFARHIRPRLPKRRCSETSCL